MTFENVCHDCGCKCVCDHDCGGDYKKCLGSEKAKKCNHHCGCFIGPLTSKFPDKLKKRKK